MTSPSHSAPWEPPTPEELHAMLPQYEISAILGRGGMGAVYKGRQKKLNRDVAIKLLPETLAEGEDELNFAARFEQEAQAMANLDHPAIVSVHDFGETEAGQCYFVMEFIDGMDIHQYLQANGGKLSQENALAIASHVLDALEYAHSRGIVHRDIKPANVLLNQEGRVKIADFGLAKKIKDEGDDSPGLTMSNVALGTPDFVAPESIDGSRVPDHRADLYAVGVMLYQMLTGSLPRGQFKTPSELRPEIDFRLDEIVSRAMQTDPDDRYSSATEIRSALDLVASEPVTKVEVVEEEEAAPNAVPGKTISPAKKSKAGLWTAIAVGAVVVAVLAAVMMPGKEEEKTVAAATIPEKKETAPVEEPAQKKPEPKPDAAAPELQKTVAVVEAPEPVVPTPKVEPTEKTPGEPKEVATPVVVEAAPEPKPAPAETPAESEAPKKELIPELATRLNGYLAARQKAVLELAAKYERALTARTNTAADAGDLPLVKAFRGEAGHLTKLKTHLGETGGDPTEKIKESATLPDLNGDAPESLVQLRQTWTAERAKIKTDLDQKLRQSLVAAEKQLTQAREFDKAEIVLVFRNNLGTPSTAEPKTAPEPKPEPVVAAANAPAENPFGWKPIPDDPFPLARPVRQTTPCRVVAFRMDGKPVDEAEFRKYYGGVPADMGEVVDLEAYTTITPIADSKYYLFNPIAIRADGTCTAMNWHPEMEADPDELTDVVALSIGRFSIIALRSDGTVLATTVKPRMREETGIDFDETGKWENIVRIDAGDLAVAGVTAEGEPKFAGDNRHGQGDVPENLKSGIIDIDVNNSSGFSKLVQRGRNGYRIARIGRYVLDLDLERGHRFFLSSNPYFADERGRPTTDMMPKGSAHALEKLERSNLRDVILVARADANVFPSSLGVAAACEENDRWTFWGNTDEVGGFDPDYCAERAEGAWKVFPMYPYVLALKPASKLTPEDWTGAPPGEKIEKAKPETSPPSPGTVVSKSKAEFPLPLPTRPTRSGHIVVLRRDGKPLDAADEHPIANIPDDLRSEVVQFSVNNGPSGPKDGVFGVATLKDGTAGMWGGTRHNPAIADKLADERRMRPSNIVKAVAGVWTGLFLDDKGRLFGTGSNVEIDFTEGLERIRLPEPAVDISCRSGVGIALFANGDQVVVTKGDPNTALLEKLPRTVAIETVFGFVSLGEDFVWRSFLIRTPGEMSTQFPSEGLIGQSSASENVLAWIGGDGKPRINYIDGRTRPTNFELVPKEFREVTNAVAIHQGYEIQAVCNESGDWTIVDKKNEGGIDLAPRLKGATAIESTYEYIFALMPGEE